MVDVFCGIYYFDKYFSFESYLNVLFIFKWYCFKMVYCFGFSKEIIFGYF